MASSCLLVSFELDSAISRQPPPSRKGFIANPSPVALPSRIDLHLQGTRAIHVIAVITAQGDHMITAIEEPTAQAAAEKPRASKKASVGQKRAHVAPKKGKSAKKASAAKKAPRPAKEKGTREGSKAAKVLDMLKRPDGVTLAELMKATGWQAHSVRGFLSGTVSKKLGLAVTSAKVEDGERTYSVKS